MYAIVEKIGLRWTVILGASVLIMIFPEILGAALKLVVSILISLLSSIGR
jgi:hypothetical protein